MMPETKRFSLGTVLVFGATLKTKDEDFLRINEIKEFALEAIRKIGLTFRRFSVEMYKKPKNAATLVCFLDESHFIVTTYPEAGIVEVELASCRSFELKGFVHYLREKKAFEISSMFAIDKDYTGKWSIGL